MDNTLSKPRPEFNGNPACPWIRKYRDRIQVVEAQGSIREPLETACSMLEPMRLMAICVAFPRKPPIHSIKRVCDAMLNDERFQHLHILINDHKLKGTVQGFYTGYRECPLVIIQNKQKLQVAREHTKRLGYYK